MPHVVNRHHFKSPPAGAIYVGRGTPLGNPYTLDGRTREEALDLYRQWLWKKICAYDHDVLQMLDRIKESTPLVCSCAPKSCHADIVCAAWTWMREEREEQRAAIEKFEKTTYLAPMMRKSSSGSTAVAGCIAWA